MVFLGFISGQQIRFPGNEPKPKKSRFTNKYPVCGSENLRSGAISKCEVPGVSLRPNVKVTCNFLTERHVFGMGRSLVTQRNKLHANDLALFGRPKQKPQHLHGGSVG